MTVIPERTEKASNNLQITCGQKGRRCPSGARKYRGVNKCWGCRFATWPNLKTFDQFLLAKGQVYNIKPEQPGVKPGT